MYIFIICSCFQFVKEICISPSQLPIALATFDPFALMFASTERHAIISGWGRINSFGWPSQNLKKLSVSIIDNDVCQAYFNDTIILSSHICTLERKGVGACKVNT